MMDDVEDEEDSEDEEEETPKKAEAKVWLWENLTLWWPIPALNFINLLLMFNFEGWPQQEEANRICNQNTCSC